MRSAVQNVWGKKPACHVLVIEVYDAGRARMIGRLNHVAIAVKDLAAASRVYRETLGAELSEPLPQPEHGVTVVFVTLPEHQDRAAGAARRELAHRRASSAATRTAASTTSATRSTTSSPPATGWSPPGARVLGSGEPRIGAHGKPVLFLHPKDFLGTLVELEQA